MHRLTGLSPPLNILLTVPRRYFFCGTFIIFCLVFAMPLCVSVYMCLVVICWENAELSLLSFVVSKCEFVTFPLVSWDVWIPDLCTLTYLF